MVVKSLLMADYDPKFIKRKGQTVPVSEALQSLFENGKSPLSQQFLRWKMWQRWPEFVGATLGSCSQPVGYVRGTLYIWVKNSTWMQQVIFLKDSMKDSLNQKLGFEFVKNIHFTLDPKSVPRDAQEAAELREAISTLSTGSNSDDSSKKDDFEI